MKKKLVKFEEKITTLKTYKRERFRKKKKEKKGKYA